MIQCSPRLCFAVLGISVFFATAQAQTPATPAPQPPAAPSVAPVDNETVPPINMPDGTIESVLGLLEMWTGRIVLRPASLPAANYHLVNKEPMPKTQAVLAIETLMNMNGVGIAPLGDKFIKVVALQSIRTESPELIEGTLLGLPASGRIVSKVFTLQFMRVNEFLPQIVPLLNPNLGGPVLFDKANAALLTDSVSTLQRVELLMTQLDRPVTAGMEPKFYPLRFAKASDLVNKIRTILQGALQNQLGTATTFNADDRTNQLVLIADPRLHKFFDDLVAKLDVKADPNTRNEVIYLKHAASKDVAALVSQLISGQTSAAGKTGQQSVRPGQIVVPGQQPPAEGAPAPEAVNAALGAIPGSTEFSSLVTVIPDERSNAVVVSGTVDDILLIRELVEKIDVLLSQVRIEVVIAEVTLGDNETSGIDSLGLQVRNNRLIGIAGSGAGTSVSGDVDADGNPTGFATVTGSGALAAIINLESTPRKDNANILSVPNIVTTHNKKASIFVGESRPVITGYLNTGTTTGADIGSGYTSTVSSKDIGIQLDVTPLIGEDGSVQLEIKQEVNDILGDILIDGNPQPRIGRRTTESFVSVSSGDIIVLGGLQRSARNRSTSRLGPIPIIGDLLGTRRREDTRTDLVFFLRPVVLTNTEADNVEAMQRIETLPNRNEIKRALNPTAQPVVPPEPEPKKTPVAPRVGPR